MHTETEDSPPHTKKKFSVFVTYNGLTKEFEVVGTQTVKSLLEKAMDTFGVQQNRHIQALYPVGGPELPENSALTDAGVFDDAQLQLRPSAVKGGALVAAGAQW
jgi:hypothetical protein